MTEKKVRLKEQQHLSDEQIIRLVELTNKKHTRKHFRESVGSNEKGVSTARISGWRRHKSWPNYCALYLEILDLKKKLSELAK